MHFYLNLFYLIVNYHYLDILKRHCIVHLIQHDRNESRDFQFKTVSIKSSLHLSGEKLKTHLLKKKKKKKVKNPWKPTED